ncbi:glucan phosphoethanolaminetransferase (alkaline phosphatase superfamily) [Dysgonomonadaceae bacterium PH5-43]|nr:glucan phosphoethanolaminetransferase (alkaline phosphatase superfamily) [Dysgonomonadaceae bacterium PH5-43]
MIQRIQTVWLFVVAVLFLLFTFNPGAWTEGFQYETELSIATKTVNIVVVLLSLITIFSYKNRKLQIKLCGSIIALTILSIILTASVFLLSPGEGVPPTADLAEQGIEAVAHLRWDFVSMFYPVVSLIFTVLAIVAINKDEKLVKSLDRLR